MGNIAVMSKRAEAYCKMKGYANDAFRDAAYQAFVSGVQEAKYLLEALEMMVAWTERHKLDTAGLITGQNAEVPVVAMARAAIAKAKAD